MAQGFTESARSVIGFECLDHMLRLAVPEDVQWGGVAASGRDEVSQRAEAIRVGTFYFGAFLEARLRCLLGGAGRTCKLRMDAFSRTCLVVETQVLSMSCCTMSNFTDRSSFTGACSPRDH